MKIRKNGLLCKLAYGRPELAPENTSICPLFWRAVLGSFGWLLGDIVWDKLCYNILWGRVIYPVVIRGLFDYVIIRGLGSIPAFLLFGYKPRLELKWREGNTNLFTDSSLGYGDLTPFDPISWWPRMRPKDTDGGGPHIMPIFLLVAAFITALIICGCWIILKGVWELILLGINSLPEGVRNATSDTLPYTLVGIGLTLLLKMAWTKIRQNSNGKEVTDAGMAWVKAKWDKVCPTVEFVEDDKTSD